MIEFVTSSGMKRVSPTGPPSSRKLGPRPVPPVVPTGVREPAMLDWVGKPGAPVVVGLVGVVVPGPVEEEVDPEPRPKMASSVPARSRDLVFSA